MMSLTLCALWLARSFQDCYAEGDRGVATLADVAHVLLSHLNLNPCSLNEKKESWIARVLCIQTCTCVCTVPLCPLMLWCCSPRLRCSEVEWKFLWWWYIWCFEMFWYVLWCSQQGSNCSINWKYVMMRRIILHVTFVMHNFTCNFSNTFREVMKYPISWFMEISHISPQGILTLFPFSRQTFVSEETEVGYFLSSLFVTNHQGNPENWGLSN